MEPDPDSISEFYKSYAETHKRCSTAMSEKFKEATFSSHSCLWKGAPLFDQLVDNFMVECFAKGAVGGLEMVKTCVRKAFDILCPKTGWENHRFATKEGATVANPVVKSRSVDMIIDSCVPEFVLASIFEEHPESARNEDVLHIVTKASRIPLACLLFKTRGSLVNLLAESKSDQVKVDENGNFVNIVEKLPSFTFAVNNTWTKEFIKACPVGLFTAKDSAEAKRNKCQNLLRIFNGGNAAQSKRNRETVADVKSKVQSSEDQIRGLAEDVAQANETASAQTRKISYLDSQVSELQKARLSERDFYDAELRAVKIRLSEVEVSAASAKSFVKSQFDDVDRQLTALKKSVPEVAEKVEATSLQLLKLRKSVCRLIEK